MEALHPMWERLREGIIALGPRMLTAIVIVLVGYVLAKLVSRASFTAITKRPRGATLAPLIRSIVSVLILATAISVALDKVGIPIATLIAGAGVAGLAIGFGAQSLVKDVISGFFHIVEGVLAVGDIAQVGDVTGTVEEVGLRVTKVRTFNGQLWYIPNGTIDRVGNFNRGWCRAVVEVPLTYEHDVRRAMSVLQEVGAAWATEQKELVQEPPVVEGVLGLNPSNLTVRLVAKVKPQQHWGVERELRLRVQEALRRERVEIPYSRQIVYHRQEPGASLELGRGSGRDGGANGGGAGESEEVRS